MADNSHIEWTGATWNPITGCSVVSPGCTHCYAMGLAGGRLRGHPSRAGLTTPSKAGPVWTGEVRLNTSWLDQPLRWKRPREIFVCAHGDLFHEAVPDAWIDQVFAVMALAPQHTFQVLTKRAERMAAYLAGDDDPILDAGSWSRAPWRKRAPGARTRIAQALQRMCPVAEWHRGNVPWPLANVHLGVSAEDQARADERIPLLLATPAAVRFVSLEPLLGPIDARWAMSRNRVEIAAGFLRRGHFSPGLETLRPIDWVIVGGESGPRARPMHPAWARQIRDDCAAAGVPFFFKQWGEWATDGCGAYVLEASGDTAWPDGTVGAGGAERNGGRGLGLYRFGKTVAGRMLDGVIHDGKPGAR